MFVIGRSCDELWGVTFTRKVIVGESDLYKKGDSHSVSATHHHFKPECCEQMISLGVGCTEPTQRWQGTSRGIDIQKRTEHKTNVSVKHIVQQKATQQTQKLMFREVGMRGGARGG